MILIAFLMAAAGLAAMGLSQAGHHQWAFDAPVKRAPSAPLPERSSGRSCSQHDLNSAERCSPDDGSGLGCAPGLSGAPGETAGDKEKAGHRARPFLTHPSPLPFGEWNKGGLTPARAQLLRWGGLALTGLSLAPAMLGWGAAFGAVGWFGLLSLAAGALLLARTYLTPPTRR